MSVDLHKNFSYSAVATAPSPALSGTSLVVSAGEGALFPTPPFNATVWPSGVSPLASNAEIVRVTAISTDTFTITRAQEGSTAKSIASGYQIAATITAKTLTDVEGLVQRPLADFFTTVGTVGSTAGQSLYSYTIPANTLNNNGDKIWYQFSGDQTGNANSKTRGIGFGSNIVYGTSSSSGTTWTIFGFIIRVNSTTVRITFNEVNLFGGNFSTNGEYGSYDFTNTITIAMKADGGATNDLIAKAGSIRFEPAA